MPAEDILLTIAEFGVALAGFTSISVVFSRRGDLVDVDRFRVRNALLGSLGVAFEPQSGIYVLGLLGLLMTGAFGFLRTLFVRPSPRQG